MAHPAAPSATAKAAEVPSGADDGGNGSRIFGTLSRLGCTRSPDALSTPAGISLGSGVKGDGVIDSMTYDGTTYRFTPRWPW